MEKYTEFRAPVSEKAEETKSKNRGGTKLTYFLIGCGVGAAGALLLSPKFGKEIRGKISDVALVFASKLSKDLRAQIDRTTEHGYEAAREIFKDIAGKGRNMIGAVVEEAKEAIDRSTNQLSEVIEETKEALIKSVERLSEAIEAGKQAYMEEKNKAEKEEKHHGTHSF